MNLKATLDEQELVKVRSIAQGVVNEERGSIERSILGAVRNELRQISYGNSYYPLYYTYPTPSFIVNKDSISTWNPVQKVSVPTASTAIDKPDLGKYAGKLVFVEQQGTNDKGEPVSGYYNGEYFVIRDTPGIIYAVKLVSAYGGHETKQLPLLGKNPYKVLDSYAPTADQITTYIKDMSAFLEKGKIKKEWVDSVYTSAESNLRAVKRATGR